MFNKFIISNRPISPHLLIYSPQLSSLFSIWHRISGIILISSLTCFLIYIKLSLIFNHCEFIFSFSFLDSKWMFNYFNLFILFILLYHSFNGIRHMIWDLGFFLESKYLFISSCIMTSLISIILILNLINL